jgi:toxin ParE1/3/4
MVRLIWAPKSLRELENIFVYISVDSVDYARIFVRKIIDAAKTIPEFPLLGRIVPEFKDERIRERIFKNYRIIYRIGNDEIEIVTIFHNARQLNEEDI